MKKDNKKLKIVINGNETNKSEIVYNNLLNNMDSTDLSKDKQIEYLKSRINFLETNIKSKALLTLIILINFIVLCLGIFFICIDYKILGIIIDLVSFVSIILSLTKFYKKYNNVEVYNNFSEIETLRKLLNAKLKWLVISFLVFIC